jgi:hypothetical protein
MPFVIPSAVEESIEELSFLRRQESSVCHCEAGLFAGRGNLYAMM